MEYHPHFCGGSACQKGRTCVFILSETAYVTSVSPPFSSSMAVLACHPALASSPSLLALPPALQSWHLPQQDGHLGPL